MIAPDTQAELILSFVEERRQQMRDVAAAADAEGRPRLAKRILASAGDALIELGTTMKRHGQPDFARPAVATHMEAN
jgi:hypothetical protein